MLRLQAQVAIWDRPFEGLQQSLHQFKMLSSRVGVGMWHPLMKPLSGFISNGSSHKFGSQARPPTFTKIMVPTGKTYLNTSCEESIMK
jgi:hypothetical protein